MPFLDLADGARLYYETHGSGPALVFAHGLGGSHLTWWQQIPRFRDRYTCVVFAHRGFFPSTVPGEVDPTLYTADLEALLRHLGIGEVRLVGQSMGGWTCLNFTLAHPDRVRALVMACTVGSLAHPEVNRAAAILRERARERDLFARGIHPACGERMAAEQPAMHFLYQQVSGLSPDLDREALRARLYAARNVSPERAAALRTPTLCLTGEEDVVIPSEAVAVLARTLPNARLARVPAAGHSVYWERPAEFNRLVDEFLSEAG